MSTDFTAVFHEFDAAIDANNVSAIIDISKRHLDASFRSALFDRVNRIVEEWAAGDVDRDRKETRRLMNYLYAVGVGADHVTISFLQELFNQREKFILLRSNNNKVGDNVVRCVAAQLVNVGAAPGLPGSGPACVHHRYLGRRRSAAPRLESGRVASRH